jgi:hypothetical protein
MWRGESKRLLGKIVSLALPGQETYLWRLGLSWLPSILGWHVRRSIGSVSFHKQVGFQKILTLTYVDKLIDDVHRLFRDKYRTEIQQQSALSLLNGTFDFQNDFLRLLR